MDPFTIAALGASAVSGLMSIFGGGAAARRQRAQTNEEVRRMRAEGEQRLSQGQAAAAASGLELPGSSMDLYLREMRSELERQIAWTRKVGSQRAGDLSLAGWMGGFNSFAGGLASASRLYSPAVPGPGSADAGPFGGYGGQYGGQIGGR